MAVKRFRKKNNFRGGSGQYRRPLIFSGTKIRRPAAQQKFVFPGWVKKTIFYAAIFLGIIYYLFFSSQFRIKDIIIQGNDLISRETIEGTIPRGSNIFLFNITETKKRILRENTQIKNVEIYRGIPNALKVVVLEYDNKLIWESGGVQYLVSSQGRVTKQLQGGESFSYPKVVDSKNVPITLGSNIVSPSFVSFVLNINNGFFNETNIKPVYFQVAETTFDINLYTEAGFYVKLNTMRASAKQLENLKKVLVEKKPEIKEYVDLRIDGLAYYK